MLASNDATVSQYTRPVQPCVMDTATFGLERVEAAAGKQVRGAGCNCVPQKKLTSRSYDDSDASPWRDFRIPSCRTTRDSCADYYLERPNHSPPLRRDGCALSCHRQQTARSTPSQQQVKYCPVFRNRFYPAIRDLDDRPQVGGSIAPVRAKRSSARPRFRRVENGRRRPLQIQRSARANRWPLGGPGPLRRGSPMKPPPVWPPVAR